MLLSLFACLSQCVSTEELLQQSVDMSVQVVSCKHSNAYDICHFLLVASVFHSQVINTVRPTHRWVAIRVPTVHREPRG